MKKIFGLILLSVAVWSCTNGAEQTSELAVSGNCMMCKETIEASLAVDGVQEANWDKKTKLLTVTFDTTLINLPTIAGHIAKAGYDNELAKGDDEAYHSLHGCCQYERE